MALWKALVIKFTRFCTSAPTAAIAAVNACSSASENWGLFMIGLCDWLERLLAWQQDPPCLLELCTASIWCSTGDGPQDDQPRCVVGSSWRR